MDAARHIRLLQLTYAAQLADAVRQYGRAGILEQVTAERRAARLAAGAAQAAQMGIDKPAAAFTTPAELFGCADWSVAPAAQDDRPAAAFVASARHCLLCAMVKKSAGPSPCRLFCLDPIEAMVKGLAPAAGFDVEETLYDGGQCRVRVSGAAATPGDGTDAPADANGDGRDETGTRGLVQ
jgi:hypothetical protein